MNILIAPDSFKGSLSAPMVAKAMEDGLKRNDAQIHCFIMPVGDGGEGTVSSLIKATGGTFSDPVSVPDPLGRLIPARYGVNRQGDTAIIELAESSGLSLLKADERNPAVTSTKGTGELIKSALDDGFRTFIICLGGSATNDGGTGILQALGFRFLDEDGQELPNGGLALNHLSTIDLSNADPRLQECEFTIASDVTNPLVGKEGASIIFGPQKGAVPELVEQLDMALSQYADIIHQLTGQSFHNKAGAGAAGGSATGILAFFPATLKSGIQTVLEAQRFNDLIATCPIDLIMTGEGKIDGQTSYGKVISGLADFGKTHDIPVIAIGGQVIGDLQNLYELGLTSAFSIVNGPMSLEESIENAYVLIENQAFAVGRLLDRLKTL